MDFGKEKKNLFLSFLTESINCAFVTIFGLKPKDLLVTQKG